jgi:hypothetical protein
VPVTNVQWITPDDGQRNCQKHVELRTRINLEIIASVGFIVKKFVTMHGHMIGCTVTCNDARTHDNMHGHMIRYTMHGHMLRCTVT